jgi:DNA polymerase-3 subunit alpha
LEEKTRDNYHVVLIATNWQAVKELNKLLSIANDRTNSNHFYFDGRISMDELANTSDDILVTTACLGSPLSKGRGKGIHDKFLEFLIKNKHRCWLEIQYHNVDDQIEYNRYLYQLHQQYGIPLIVGTDTHASTPELLTARRILQQAKGISTTDEDTFDLSFKSYDELVNAFEQQNSLPMDVVMDVSTTQTSWQTG